MGLKMPSTRLCQRLKRIAETTPQTKYYESRFPTDNLADSAFNPSEDHTRCAIYIKSPKAANCLKTDWLDYTPDEKLAETQTAIAVEPTRFSAGHHLTFRRAVCVKDKYDMLDGMRKAGCDDIDTHLVGQEFGIEYFHAICPATSLNQLMKVNEKYEGTPLTLR